MPRPPALPHVVARHARGHAVVGYGAAGQFRGREVERHQVFPRARGDVRPVPLEPHRLCNAVALGREPRGDVRETPVDELLAAGAGPMVEPVDRVRERAELFVDRHDGDPLRAHPERRHVRERPPAVPRRPAERFRQERPPQFRILLGDAVFRGHQRVFAVVLAQYVQLLVEQRAPAAGRAEVEAREDAHAIPPSSRCARGRA